MVKTDIRLGEELWGSSMLPEGVLEKWRCANGEFVQTGVPVAEVRVEGAVHEILAPCTGRLDTIARVGLVEPGAVIGRIDWQASSAH